MTEPEHTDRSQYAFFWIVAIGWCVLPLMLIMFTGTAKETLSDFGVQTSGLSSVTITAVDWLKGNHPAPGAMALPGMVYAVPLWLAPLVGVFLLVRRFGERGPMTVLMFSMCLLLVAGALAAAFALAGDLLKVGESIS